MMMRLLPQIGERETEPCVRKDGQDCADENEKKVSIRGLYSQPLGSLLCFVLFRALGDAVKTLLFHSCGTLSVFAMVLGLISLAATVPMVATSVLNLQSQAENTKSHGIDAKWKTDKCHMRCRPSERTPDDRKRLFQDSRVVLRGGKLYAQLSSYEGEQLHPFSGYFLPYPDSNFEGLVSTISDEPPQLNWIYLDTGSKISHISHGLRAEAEEGLTGPWGARVCADGEIRFLMENWEGFIAVESETPGLWGLCFDRYDDGLKGKLGDEQRTVELELVREAINA